MTTDEMYRQICSEQPTLLYLTGKTCAGKTTFSGRLNTACGYDVIELDTVLVDTVVRPLGLLDRQGDVFVSVCKKADNQAWVDTFVAAAKERIASLLAQNKKVIIDGAIANMTVVHRIFDDLEGTTFIYFHPTTLSKDYIRNITQRFAGTSINHQNGLPNAFWKFIDQAAFRQYCQDKILTPALEQSIASYAESSSQSSAKRLKALQESFSPVSVVEV